MTHVQCTLSAITKNNIKQRFDWTVNLKISDNNICVVLLFYFSMLVYHATIYAFKIVSFKSYEEVCMCISLFSRP